MKKPRPLHHHKKSGAALLIALGFLAILVIMVIAFSAQTRTGRIAGQAYLSSAQTRQLLHAALARSLEDIESTAGPNFPAFMAMGSEGIGDGEFLDQTLGFQIEEDYIPIGNTLIRNGYLEGKDEAQWQTVYDGDNRAVGRVGYIIVNTSGLLDANAVGGREREAGLSPAELKLDSKLLDELANRPESGELLAKDRNTMWRRFESLRDLRQLNLAGATNTITGDIASFWVQSFFPSNDARIFMGTNSATLAVDEIEAELEKFDAVDPAFVLNQLRDYLDTDSLPENENGDYTDLSVEPTPLLNELVLECTFTFIPVIDEEGEGEEATNRVSSVAINNTYQLQLETWDPFVGQVNKDTYSVSITEDPLPADEGAEFNSELLGDISEWETADPEPVDANRDLQFITMYSAATTNEATSADELVELFREMAVDLVFPAIICSNEEGWLVDRVEDLDFPLGATVEDELLLQMEELAEDLFGAESQAAETNLAFRIGMAVVDPRLNWDGRLDAQQWIEVGSSTNTFGDSLGSINTEILDAYSDASGPFGMAHVRNEDRLNTPFEFTYLLYNPDLPWKTFDMLNDEDDTRFIMTNLTTYANGPPRTGRINPYSPQTNVIATAFMDMPVDEFLQPAQTRLDDTTATAVAELFMDSLKAQGSWPESAAEYIEMMDADKLDGIIDADGNPWIIEGIFRNSYELFDPSGSTYAIFLVAQSGRDIDGDNIINNGETTASQQAVAYVWRDSQTGKAACTFFGLSSTLRLGKAGTRWSDVLSDFKP